MPVTSSGQISMQDIMNELGISGETSLNDADIRALISKANQTETMMSEFYGASSAFSFTVTTSQQEQSVSSLAQAAGWDGSSAIIMTINSGVYLWSDNILNPGLLIDVAGCKVINNGYIIGRGGDGGANNRYYLTHDGQAGSGQNGGQAINVSASGTTIINNAGAYIAGGGGGGFGWFEPGGGGAGGGLGATSGGAIGQASEAPFRYGYVGGVLPSWSVGSEGSGCGGSGSAHAGTYSGGRRRKIIGSGGSGGGRILTGTGGGGAYFQVPSPTTVIYFSAAGGTGYFANIFPAYARYYGGTGGNAPPTPPKATGTNEKFDLGTPGGGGWGAAGGAGWDFTGNLRSPGASGGSGFGGAAIAGTSRTVTNNGTIWGSTA
jgi:hypothetical protein